MKLSADIIYEHLSGQIKLERFGPKDDEPALKSVLFYEEGMSIQKGLVYLIKQDNICEISEAQLENKGHLILCVGRKPPHTWVKNGYSFFVTEPLESSSLFNMIQRIFSRYYDWEERLRNILEDDADIRKMVLCSADIFENPISITNHNLEILGAAGYSEENGGHWYLYDYKSIPLEYVERFHSLYNQYTQRKTPYLHDDNGHELVYCVNLYIHEKYRGCVSISELCRPFRSGDYKLFQYFAQYIKKALSSQLRNSRSSFFSIKSDLQSLLNKVHIDELKLISSLNDSGLISNDINCSWICIVTRPNNNTHFMELEYIISSLEEKLPECIALPYEDDILLIMQLPPSDETSQAVLDKIVPVLNKLGFYVGVSDRFQQLSDIRIAYKKACCAIETGAAHNSNEKVYHFSDYVLSYMLLHAKGEFLLQDILPPGLSALLEHDKTSNVSYLETLRCYLANRLNTAKTARDLYLHRSSVLQRLERIFEILGTRLKTADEQLYYSICLYLLESGN